MRLPCSGVAISLFHHHNRILLYVHKIKAITQLFLFISYFPQKVWNASTCSWSTSSISNSIHSGVRVCHISPLVMALNFISFMSVVILAVYQVCCIFACSLNPPLMNIRMPKVEMKYIQINKNDDKIKRLRRWLMAEFFIINNIYWILQVNSPLSQVFASLGQHKQSVRDALCNNTTSGRCTKKHDLINSFLLSLVYLVYSFYLYEIIVTSFLLFWAISPSVAVSSRGALLFIYTMTGQCTKN